MRGYNDILNCDFKIKKAKLTEEEAAAYSNIGINRISNMLNSPFCPFVYYVGTKRLVKRKEFEKYLEKTSEFGA